MQRQLIGLNEDPKEKALDHISAELVHRYVTHLQTPSPPSMPKTSNPPSCSTPAVSTTSPVSESNAWPKFEQLQTKSRKIGNDGQRGRDRTSRMFASASISCSSSLAENFAHLPSSSSSNKHSSSNCFLLPGQQNIYGKVPMRGGLGKESKSQRDQEGPPAGRMASLGFGRGEDLEIGGSFSN